MSVPQSPSAKPSLVLLEGETSARVYELDRDVTSIGRSSRNDIRLSRLSVSRQHARIVREGGRYYFEDLDSDSGSLVDDRPANERVRLRHGTKIEISKYTFAFHDPSFRIEEDSEQVILSSVDFPSSTDGSSSLVKPEEKLRHLIEISRSVGDTLNLDSVLARTLEALCRIFPQADRAFFVLKEGDEIDAVPRAIRFRSGQTGDYSISRTIYNLVMNDAKGILSTDVPHDRRLAHAESIYNSKVRTVMCVPLMDHRQTPRGILQIDTREESGRFRKEDLDLLAAVAVLVGVAVDNARLHAAQIERTEIEVEERDAKQVQMAFLPGDLPTVAGYEFWHKYEPSRFVGGDYFDYLPAVAVSAGPVTRWHVLLGDVAGKGLPAALLMARLSAEVRMLVQSGLEPSAMLERLNRDFADPRYESRFISLLLVLLDTERHTMEVVSAGHMGPMIRRADGRVEIIGDDSGAFWIGVAPDTVYQPEFASLEPGDTVVLYTDGVNEAINPKGKPFGTDRLKSTVRKTTGASEAVGKAILKAVRDHANGTPQSDDLTLLCFTRI